MLKKLFAITLFTWPIMAHAQITLNAQLPQAGFVQKEQFWNLILVNNNADVLDVTMQLNLQDANTGQVVLTATTGNLLLNKGVKMIRSGDIQPITYNYTVPDLSKNYLPMGTYLACYRIIDNTNRKETPIAEECIRINIDPLSPPLLNSPADKSAIESPYPQFTWMPPTPFDMFSSLTYDLLVTEVLQGQSAIEAIQYNTPVYSKGNISRPYESYASSFNKLDTGKIYAWQVIAKNGLSYAAKTEVWTFRITAETPSTKSSNITYITLGKENGESGIYNLKDDNLNIKYFSFDRAFDAVIKIKTTSGEIVQDLKQKILYGDNFFNIKLTKAITKEKQYMIVLEGQEGKTYTSLFSINNK